MLVGGVCWADLRASQGGELCVNAKGVNAKLGGKIVKDMKMLEGRKRVYSPCYWSAICLQVSTWIKHHRKAHLPETLLTVRLVVVVAVTY